MASKKEKVVIEEREIPQDVELKTYKVKNTKLGKEIEFTLPIRFIVPRQTHLYSPQIEEPQEVIKNGIVQITPGYSVTFVQNVLDINDPETAKRIIQSRFFEDTIFIDKTRAYDGVPKTQYTEGASTTATMKGSRKV